MVKVRAHMNSSFPTRIINLLYKSCEIRRRSDVHETLLFACKMHGAWFWAGLPYKEKTHVHTKACYILTCKTSHL